MARQCAEVLAGGARLRSRTDVVVTRETAHAGGSQIFPVRSIDSNDSRLAPAVLDDAAVDFVAEELGVVVDHKGYADLAQARAILDAPPAVLEALWQKVTDLAKHRRIDPGLRSDILRVAEQVDPDLVEQLKHEMDEAVPSAVLEAHQDELIPDRLTLGAFPMAGKLPAPSIEEWLREDPRRLRGVLIEASRFCRDDRQLVESTLQLAKDVGIDLKLAADVVSHALMDARQPQAVAR